MTEDETKEQLAAMRSEMDQAVEATKEVARALGVFRRELEEQGFELPERIALCCEYLRTMLGLNRSGD